MEQSSVLHVTSITKRKKEREYHIHKNELRFAAMYKKRETNKIV